WTRQPSGVFDFLFSAAFADEQTAFVVGTAGTILRSTDGGATWGPVEANTNATLRDIVILDSGTLGIVGDNGTILLSEGGIVRVRR
ncbi:MAG: hypothetical protein JSW50_00255, partial [Candidatus Latescibacterota bacterium]